MTQKHCSFCSLKGSKVKKIVFLSKYSKPALLSPTNFVFGCFLDRGLFSLYSNILEAFKISEYVWAENGRILVLSIFLTVFEIFAIESFTNFWTHKSRWAFMNLPVLPRRAYGKLNVGLIFSTNLEHFAIKLVPSPPDLIINIIFYLKTPINWQI